MRLPQYPLPCCCCSNWLANSSFKIGCSNVQYIFPFFRKEVPNPHKSFFEHSYQCHILRAPPTSDSSGLAASRGQKNATSFFPFKNPFSKSLANLRCRAGKKGLMKFAPFFHIPWQLQKTGKGLWANFEDLQFRRRNIFLGLGKKDKVDIEIILIPSWGIFFGGGIGRLMHGGGTIVAAPIFFHNEHFWEIACRA